ncbi:uncharacterized protein G2W53_039121 [Senna tora]|uniref:Uncharacterized protein n=1 Tax=Senna tora TaxID=362788 RepID=A0A834W2J6_9FABA|nr:uncharacterized protein G2W53_039121 [Senna tora]
MDGQQVVTTEPGILTEVNGKAPEQQCRKVEYLQSYDDRQRIQIKPEKHQI